MGGKIGESLYREPVSRAFFVVSTIDGALQPVGFSALLSPLYGSYGAQVTNVWRVVSGHENHEKSGGGRIISAPGNHQAHKFHNKNSVIYRVTLGHQAGDLEIYSLNEKPQSKKYQVRVGWRSRSPPAEGTRSKWKPCSTRLRSLDMRPLGHGTNALPGLM